MAQGCVWRSVANNSLPLGACGVTIVRAGCLHMSGPLPLLWSPPPLSHNSWKGWDGTHAAPMGCQGCMRVCVRGCACWPKGAGTHACEGVCMRVHVLA